jgi:gliding motility-associated-like protein
MRKFILSVCLCFPFFVSAFAQLQSNQGKAYTTFTGVNYVFIFNGIDDNTQIKYNGLATDVKWYKYSDATPIYTGVDTFDQLENATGYILEEANGNRISFWVIDYQNYIPILNSLEPDLTTESQCEEVLLLLNATVPPIHYQTPSGLSFSIPRDFKLNYQTLEWITEWKTTDVNETITLPKSSFTVSAPLSDTYFTLSDILASELGIEPVTVKSALYSAVAVKCNPTSVVTTRDERNEADRPNIASMLRGSAPLDILFQSNANEPIARFYKWEIFKDNKLLISRTDKDHRYTFTEAGTYKVKVTVSNSDCSHSDSINVIVSESDLSVPNVFTPNGDGVNDEFRVAYKSLISFHCTVYNRWGRKIFEWSDPTKGWDGTINGKPAAAGAYVYLIKAKGSDNKEYVRKGDINLIRVSNSY